MLRLSPKDMKSAYKFFISAIIPRPIALVSSISEEGIVNVGKYLGVNVILALTLYSTIFIF